MGCKIILLISLFTLQAFAFTPPAFVPNVVDQAQILTASEIEELNQTIQQIRDYRGIWAAVLIINSLNGEPIESAAVNTFASWQLGKRGADNGLLFLVAVQDRKMRLEVGYGLEGELTDAYARQIIDQIATPYFRGEEWLLGIQQTLLAAARLEPKEPLPQFTAQEESFADPFHKKTYLLWVYFLLFFHFFGPHIFKRHNHKTISSKRKWAHYLGLNPTRVFITIFLLINPGVFIALIPYSEVQSTFSNIVISLSEVKYWTYLLSFLVFSPVVHLLSLLIPDFSIRSSKIYHPEKKLSLGQKFYKVLVKRSFYQTFGLTLGFTFLYLLSPFLPFILIVIPVAIYLALVFHQFCLRASTAYYKYSAVRSRWSRMRSRKYGKRVIFGKSYNFKRPSRSGSSGSGGSSRSSSSRSSSSGGGRSGGGGASGSW